MAGMVVVVVGVRPAAYCGGCIINQPRMPETGGNQRIAAFDVFLDPTVYDLEENSWLLMQQNLHRISFVFSFQEIIKDYSRLIC